MKRTLATALLPLVATSLLVAGSATNGGADENGSCALPTAERSYTRDQLVYRLAVDVTDCDWWDGSPVQLDGSIERVDPTGDHNTGSNILCGTAVALPDPGDTETDEHMPADSATAEPNPKARTSSTGMRSGACAVEVSIDHPSPELAHYRGEITFPWEGDRRTVSFTALCGGNAGGCIDLPVPLAPDELFAQDHRDAS
jgi:hypothetical protein